MPEKVLLPYRNAREREQPAGTATAALIRVALQAAYPAADRLPAEMRAALNKLNEHDR